MASAASIARRNLPQKSSSQPTPTPTLYSQKVRSPALRVGGVLAGGRVVDAAVRLLDLGVQSAHGDAELGPRLQHPQARDLQVVVVPVRGVDQLAEHRVAKSFPPPGLPCRRVRDDRSVGLLPLRQHRGFGLHEVGTDGGASADSQRQGDAMQRAKVAPPRDDHLGASCLALQRTHFRLGCPVRLAVELQASNRQACMATISSSLVRTA